MSELADALDQLAAEQSFTGVVRVDRGGETELAVAYGLADRRHGIPATVDTRFATASANKGFTALAVMQLVEAGQLSLSTPAREVLGADLPLIADDVTIEHLLSHRSGIGDYLDEDLDSISTRLPDAGAGAAPRHHRGVRADPRRPSRRSSPPASGSPTATAASSCWA